MRPSPVPPNLRVVDASACANGSNTCSRFSGAMPGPESATSNERFGDAPRGLAQPTVRTMPPFDVNFTAFETRFMRIWRSRVGSLWIEAGMGVEYTTWSDSPLASAGTRRSEMTSAMTRCGEQEMCSGANLPGLDLGEIEDVVDEAEEVLAVATDDLDVLGARGRREILIEQEIAEAHDGGHRRADLVAHVRQELALGLGLRRWRAPRRLNSLGDLARELRVRACSSSSNMRCLDETNIQANPEVQRTDDRGVDAPAQPASRQMGEAQ